MALVGRSFEREALEVPARRRESKPEWRAGAPGQAGVRKTALLDDAAESATARGMRVARLTGIESETQLGYAALHRLLLPYGSRLDRSPVSQRDALRSTFGLVAGPADRFMVALAEPAGRCGHRGATRLPHRRRPLARSRDADVAGFRGPTPGCGAVVIFATGDMESSTPSGPLPELVIGGLSHPRA